MNVILVSLISNLFFEIWHMQLHAIIYSTHNVITRTCTKRFTPPLHNRLITMFASFLPSMTLRSLLLNQRLLLSVYFY
jgi:hypothetical protein